MPEDSQPDAFGYWGILALEAQKILVKFFLWACARTAGLRARSFLALEAIPHGLQKSFRQLRTCITWRVLRAVVNRVLTNLANVA